MPLVAEKLNSSSGEDTIHKPRSHTHTHTRDMHDVAITCTCTCIYSDRLCCEFVGYTLAKSHALMNCTMGHAVPPKTSHASPHTEHVHSTHVYTRVQNKHYAIKIIIDCIYLLKTTCQPSGECRGITYALLSLCTCHMHGY